MATLAERLFYLAESGDDPWDEAAPDWQHPATHLARSLAAAGFLIQAAREAKFLGTELFLENMVTHAIINNDDAFDDDDSDDNDVNNDDDSDSNDCDNNSDGDINDDGNNDDSS